MSNLENEKLIGIYRKAIRHYGRAYGITIPVEVIRMGILNINEKMKMLVYSDGTIVIEKNDESYNFKKEGKV